MFDGDTMVLIKNKKKYPAQLLVKSIILVFSLLITACNEAEFFDKDFLEGAGVDPEKFRKDRDLDVTGGVPIDITEFENIDFCDQQEIDATFVTNCIGFQDSFERDVIKDNSIFNWKTVKMDYGRDARNVDATIEPASYLGEVADGEKAVVFTGREGGSTHQIYLVANPLDFQSHDLVYIQFKYVPIGLEKEITLNLSRLTVPENITLDVCTGTDKQCGLSGPKDAAKVQMYNYEYWTEYKTTDLYNSGALKFGATNEIGPGKLTKDHWELGQFVIDFDKLNLSEDRRKNFVFRITASMDEGYKKNERGRKMEDGILLDDVIVIGVSGDILIN